jgi:hypothetical protein
MRSKLAGAALAFTAIAGFCLAAASPAAASTQQIQAGSCSSGYVCLFENVNYNQNAGEVNHWRDFSGSVKTFGSLKWYNGDGSESNDKMNDETSSLKNRLGCSVTLYEHKDYEGDHTQFLNGANRADFDGTSIDHNRASSLKTAC